MTDREEVQEMCPISVVLIVYNEAERIRSCLESVLWAEEVIVIDSGSKDGTADIARSLGAKVVHHPWGGFTAQRRFALSQATNEWVLVVDADEIVTDDLRKSIQSNIGKNDFKGYFVLRLNHFWGRPIRHCGWYPDWVLRCFQKSSASIPEVSVHEGFDVKNEVGFLDGFLLHFSYNSISEYFTKMNLYTSLEAADKQKRFSRKNIHWYDLFFHAISRFFRMYFIKKGFLDGFTGFVVCFISSLYLFVLYAKMWESQRKK